MNAVTVAGVDLGASGGRVIAAPGRRGRRRAARGQPVPATSRCWPAGRCTGTSCGCTRSVVVRADATPRRRSRWPARASTPGACDYGLLDATGALIGNPVHYRDARTDGVTIPVPAAELYAVTGIQHLPFNTIYQLAAARARPRSPRARTLLLIPDLLAYWLTGAVGRRGDERLDDRAARRVLADLGHRDHGAGRDLARAVPAAAPAGRRDRAGHDTSPTAVAGADGQPLPLIAVGSHDTASAVVAVPAAGAELRLHLLRHLVAGRDGTGPRRC